MDVDDRLIRERFCEPLLLGSGTVSRLPQILARLEVAGGAVYDALVALAAREHNASLATRDARAMTTYENAGVDALAMWFALAVIS